LPSEATTVREPRAFSLGRKRLTGSGPLLFTAGSSFHDCSENVELYEINLVLTTALLNSHGHLAVRFSLHTALRQLIRAGSGAYAARIAGQSVTYTDKEYRSNASWKSQAAGLDKTRPRPSNAEQQKELNQ